MVRIGIIGAGKAGELHAGGIKASRRAALTWVADPDQARGAALAAAFGTRHIPDFRQGLADVDAVSVCTPHHLLAGVAVEAAGVGRHLLLEKPMATSLADADRVLRAARGAGVVLMVGFVHRYRPDVRRAKAIIDEGAIGVPQFVVDRTLHGDLATWPDWVRRPETGGGLTLYSGVHRIDRARWFLGREVASVYGSTASLVAGASVDSSSAALLLCAGGARAALTHHFHEIETPFSWETDVHGTEGMIRIRTGESIEVTTRQGTSREIAGPDRKFEGEIEAFVDAIQGARAGIPSGEDGRAVLAIALALFESSRTARPIALNQFMSGS